MKISSSGGKKNDRVQIMRRTKVRVKQIDFARDYNWALIEDRFVMVFYCAWSVELLSLVGSKRQFDWFCCSFKFLLCFFKLIPLPLLLIIPDIWSVIVNTFSIKSHYVLDFWYPLILATTTTYPSLNGFFQNYKGNSLAPKEIVYFKKSKILNYPLNKLQPYS